jgi:hypothetical protein
MWRERKRREKSTNVKGEALVDPEFKRAVQNETRKPALDTEGEVHLRCRS